MTRKRLTTVLLFLCLSGIGTAQTTNAFRVNYNQALFDLPGNAVEAITPNNYVFAGTNLNFLPIYGTVTQIDQLGGLSWSKRYYDGSLGFQLNDIKKDALANEYYLCGGSESNAGVFMRLDINGNVVVSKKFSISQADGAYFNRMIKTSDGGYVAVGYVTGLDPDGAGPEIDYAPITYTDSDGNTQTDVISSPLIVKFDANGNHLWHKVFRYYTNAAKDPATQRIYNDASFNDVVETADGYIAVGQYDVNQHRSATNSDGDDATPTDALILKTDFTGTITYHKQFDAVSSSTTQTSKYLSAINKTSTGVPIAGGGIDGGRAWVTKFAGTGAWSLTYSRRFTYASSFFGVDPVDISQIYEVAGSSDIVLMGMYIKPFDFIFSNSLHRINANADANVWARYYTFSLASILPRGSQVSDNGYIMTSLTTGTTDYDYHVIKTDPNGDTPLTGCAPTTFTPSPSSASTTIADPFYNFWSGTVGSQTLAVTVANITPTSSVQCSFAPCTPPAAPTAAVATQPNCSTSTGSITLSGLPTSGTWTVNGTPSGTATGNTATTTISGLAPGNYTFTVTLAGCTSTASNSVTINAAPTVPTAPVIGTITQTTCTVGTGSIQLTGLPSSGTWTVTGSPSGTASGTGTSTTISGLVPGTYTFSVSNGTCTSPSSLTATINPQPATPTAPIVGTITQPTCSTPTGSVALSGLPASGSWTITASPGGSTQTSSGTTATFTGLTGGTSYTFTITNASGCTSTASLPASINAAPALPGTPITGTVTQPTCTAPTGSVALSGLPASGTWTITASPGALTQTGSGTTATFTGLAAGTNYTFTVTNAAGCTSTATGSVGINAVPGAPTAPVVGTITQPTCTVSTGSVQLSGLPSGSWTLTMNPGAVNTAGSGTTTTVSGLTAGTYTFTVTNDLGCTSPASVNVVINAQPATPTAPILGTVTQPTCTEATGSVAISGLPSGTWTITASPGGATQTGSGTTATFTGLTTGTYTFTVTNDAGCTSTVSSTSATISAQPTTPTAPITGTVTQPTCLVPTGTVELNGLPAGSWTVTATPGGATLNGSTTSATFTGLAPGTNYTFTVTNAAGCTSTTSTSVAINTVPGAPTAPAAGTVTQPTCAIPTGTIIVDSPLGAQYTYSIDGTTFQAGTTFSGLAPGSYTITVLDNTSGCSSVSAASITIDPVANAPVVTLVSSTSVTCNGDTDGELEISIAGGQAPYAIVWNPNVGSTTTLENLAAGSYSVNVTDDAGCSTTATFTVGSPNALLVNGTSTNVLCGIADGTITTAVTGGTAPYTYAWTPNGETSTSLSGLAAGTYSVLVTDDNGCTANQNFTLTTIGNLPVDIDPSYVEIEAGESVVLTATGGDNYVWTPTTGLSCTNCPNPTANPTVTTTYYVSASDDNGCTGGDSSLVVIKLACGDLFVPTIFSPNGTGPDANNKLCVFGTASCIEDLKFQIYNRWGELVFETTDIATCWDGNYKDKPANSGIFVYRLYVKLYNNDEPIDISGNTTLVR
jgi:gliding motility-associated-like protein